MLRFPNPGSNIDSYIRIFYELFEALRDEVSFDLDDMMKVLVDRNLATSSGYTGQEALNRSLRQDRSRDPLYNQSKMYSEIYKILGWIHPFPDRALKFRFTFLGAHAASATRDINSLFKECIIGIAYPNEILGVAGNYALRPFITILRTANDLGGFIYRDEMIVGPMCLSDDRDTEAYQRMIDELRSIRGNWKLLQQRMQDMTKGRGIATNTAQNYTRFPIGVLDWSGWITKERMSGIYSSSLSFLKLTDLGYKVLADYKTNYDLRAKDLDHLSDDCKAAVSRLSVYKMLERAGFDITPVTSQVSLDTNTLVGAGFVQYINPIFSPFQELGTEYINGLFPLQFNQSNTESVSVTSISSDVIQTDTELVELLTHVSSHTKSSNNVVSLEAELKSLIDEASTTSNSIQDIVKYIAESYINTDQHRFYPFVASLFRALGYNCEHSRAGVNNYRFDAMIEDSTNSIPIEIKSPTEELYLSVKAVRQALENKIILLARGPHQTQYATTSLAVGFYPPNDRSEVLALVADIYKTYNISIGVVDIYSLIYLVVLELFENKEHDRNELMKLRGIINVTNS